MGRVKAFRLATAASFAVGTNFSAWVRIPAEARQLYLKVTATFAAGGGTIKLQTTADPNATNLVTTDLDSHDFAAGTNTYTGAEVSDFLGWARIKVIATGAGSAVTADAQYETLGPFPATRMFDLRLKAASAVSENSGWKKIPDEALSFYGVMDAEAMSTGATLDAKLQLADDALGTNAADLGSGAFTQVTDAGAAKEVKGPFTNFKQSFLRLVGTITPATLAYDATATQAPVTAASATWAHTCGGTQRYLLVGILYDATGANAGAAPTSVKYNGVNMTLLSSQAGFGTHTELWGLLAPASGANNVVVTFGAVVGNLRGGSTSFKGVNQVTPLGAVVTSVTKAITVPDAAAADLVFDLLGSDTVRVADVTAIQRFNVADGFYILGGSTKAGPNTTITWTGAAGNDRHIAVALKAITPAANYGVRVVAR